MLTCHRLVTKLKSPNSDKELTWTAEPLFVWWVGA